VFCPNCACELPAIAKFCVRCGAKTGFATIGTGTQHRGLAPVEATAIGTLELEGVQAYCGKCGARAVEGNHFCRACGSPLHAGNAPDLTASIAHRIRNDAGPAISPNIVQAQERVQRSVYESQPEGKIETSEDTPTQVKDGKRPLLTRDVWVVCSILSLLVAINNASKSGATGAGEFVPYAIGGFVGGLVFFAGGWAIIVLVSRWLSGWISRIRHRLPNYHPGSQPSNRISSLYVKRAFWLVPVAVVGLSIIWAFSRKDTHFVTGPAAPAETVSRIRITGTLSNMVVLDGSNEAPNERYRFEGRIHNDSGSEISFIRMRIRIFACGTNPQPEDAPLTQEERSRCTEVGKSVREVYAHIGPGETGDFGNFYFPERPQNYGWDYKILNAETPAAN
jgi:hypothetical protein